jgi:hypothetical protein
MTHSCMLARFPRALHLLITGSVLRLTAPLAVSVMRLLLRLLTISTIVVGHETSRSTAVLPSELLASELRHVARLVLADRLSVRLARDLLSVVRLVPLVDDLLAVDHLVDEGGDNERY